MKNLTKNQQAIYQYLKDKSWTSPTQIGREVGGKTRSGLQRHSAWASPICLRLVEKSLVERNEKGWYKAA